MARSKNCLKCHYCKGLGGDYSSKDWRNSWYCDYCTMEGRNDDKGDNPDKCKLFKSKGRTKRRRKFN